MDNELAVLRGRLAAIVESSHDAILAKDPAGVVTAWNAAAERLYGYAAVEMVGRPIAVVFPRDRRGECESIITEVLAGRVVPPHDTQRVTRDGRLIDVSVTVSPIRDGAGGVVGASTIARPASKEGAVEAERAMTAQVVANSADAIITLDLEGRITTWNPAAERMFGYAAGEAAGEPASELFGEDDAAPVDVARAVVMNKETRHFETVRRHRDGRELVLSVSAAPLLGAAGGAVIMVRDVTEARAAQERIAAAQAREARLLAELEQTRRLESVGQLAGGIAHDFNNLLGVILNIAGFLAADMPAGQAREDVEEIRTTARRAAELTRQLLIFGRRDESRPEVLDVSETVRGLEGLLRRALSERIQLDVLAAPTGSRVNMDPGRLEQVIVNLAINGRDAMPSGGRLIIEVQQTTIDEEFAATMSELAPGTYVTVTVSDTGVGMSAEVVKRAFEPFYTTKPIGQGTGLGLATVYGIIADAGGRVALYSEPGHGTSVKVHLPLTDLPQTHAATDSQGPPGHGERVLIVEDAPDVRRVAERILVTAGYEVDVAATTAEALAAAGRNDIDLVLSDVVMPEMTGPELATHMRRRRPEQKVLFMSGYSYQVLDGARLNEPGTAFIEKPFSAGQLRQHVRELLDDPRQARRGRAGQPPRSGT